MFTSKKAFHIFLIQVMAMHFLLANESSSQNLADIKLSFEIRDANLKQVFTKLESTTRFTFGYDKKILRSNVRLTFREDDISVKDILLKVGEEAHLKFKRINDQILVLKDDREEKGEKIFLVEDRPIKGTITDAETGEPLAGATIQVKGTQLGTIASVDGSFSLSIPDDAKVLVISYIGFRSREIPVSERSNYDIALSPDLSSLSEVVVIGYGVQDKADLTTSIASVSPKELKDQPVIGFDQAIVGKIAGVQVVEPSGEPGVGMRIRVRGTSSITAGNDPLYVVDGVPMNTDMQGGGSYGLDYPVIRKADAVLLLAEALNEEGYSADGEAFELLNRVRSRAGLAALTSADLADQDAFREAIFEERRLELALEGHRWFDLQRSGTAAEALAEVGIAFQPFQLLYPLPQSEIDAFQDDTRFRQNEGYN